MTATKRPGTAKPAPKPAAKSKARTAKAAPSLRAQAETLARKQPAAAPAGSPAADKRLVHELQVHQIELEVQNEQLRQANDDLAALHARYYDLYDFAPVAYFTVGVDRRLVELNLAGARLLGRERGELAGARLAEFVHATSRDAFDHLVARALVRHELVEDALVMQPAGSGPVYVKAQARRFEGAGGNPSARIVMMDLSALKSANEELARALENFFRYWRP